MIKRTTILLFLMCAATQPLTVTAEPEAMAANIESLTPFFADYEVRRSGMKIASAHYELWRDGDTYVYETRGSASGIGKLLGRNLAEEKSRFRVAGNSLQQIDCMYVLENGKEKRIRRIEFDWDKNNVSITRRGKTRIFDIANGMVDRMLLQLVIMQDIANNRLKQSYIAIGKRSPKRIEIKHMGEEVVRVPAGTYKTIKIEGLQKRRKGDRITRYWCAQELNWLPIKIEQYRNGDGPFEMKLSNIRGMGRD
jgi:hypothetical protein